MSLVSRYFELSDTQNQQFEMLLPLYKEWNSRINVVSRKDIDNLELHHVLHSLAIAKAVTFTPGSHIVDIGTGGGFPGLPLAIIFPQVNFLLVDSIGKKVKVVEAIKNELELKNVKTLNDRVENLTVQYDFATCRAVSLLDTTWGWAKPLISKVNRNNIPNGLLYLKGGDVSGELPQKVIVKRWEIAEFFHFDYFDNKSLILISPEAG
jgi:16S rRNA (guanine527-N7)-methyltransferase